MSNRGVKKQDSTTVGIQKLRSAGKGILRIHDSRQEIPEKLRHKQKSFGVIQNHRAHPLLRIKLENGIKIHINMLKKRLEICL